MRFASTQGVLMSFLAIIPESMEKIEALLKKIAIKKIYYSWRAIGLLLNVSTFEDFGENCIIYCVNPYSKDIEIYGLGAKIRVGTTFWSKM